MAKLIVSDLHDLEGKKVLIRVDFNVPVKNGVIGDDNRMVAALLVKQEGYLCTNYSWQAIRRCYRCYGKR